MATRLREYMEYCGYTEAEILRFEAISSEITRFIEKQIAEIDHEKHTPRRAIGESDDMQ